MVREPRWELHSNLGRHETYILKTIPRLLQGQWGHIWNNIGRRRNFGKLCQTLSIQPSKIKTKTVREGCLEKKFTQRHKKWIFRNFKSDGNRWCISVIIWHDVCELCRRYSRGKFKISKSIPSSQLNINPCQPCSQILFVPSDDHRDTFSYDAILPVLQYFQQYPIFQEGSTTQAS